MIEGGALEGLQIFIRPETGGLKPQVQFHDLQEIYSINKWRKIAGKGEDYPLQIRSNTWLMDTRLEEGHETEFPNDNSYNIASLFYLMKGKIQVNEDTIITSGESVLVENESPVFKALETSDIVLFTTQTDATYFEEGMYSGNQKQLVAQRSVI